MTVNSNGRGGELLKEVAAEGPVPILAEGENEVHFACSAPENARARANVTVISRSL